MAEVGCGWVRCLGCWSWLGRDWVVAEVGCWSSDIASVQVQQGHGEIGVGHGDGFGGDQRGSPYGWLVLLGFAFPMGFILFYFIFNMGFCSGGQWWRGGHGGGAMVVTGQWRCSDRG